MNMLPGTVGRIWFHTRPPFDTASFSQRTFFPPSVFGWADAASRSVPRTKGAVSVTLSGARRASIVESPASQASCRPFTCAVRCSSLAAVADVSRTASFSGVRTASRICPSAVAISALQSSSASTCDQP